jgi:hypothetical protein
MDARDIRRALAAVAHELNRAPRDWQRLSAREHLVRAMQAGDRALTGRWAVTT